MTTGVKILIGTMAGFLAVGYSWIFRARKVQSEHPHSDMTEKRKTAASNEPAS